MKWHGGAAFSTRAAPAADEAPLAEVLSGMRQRPKQLPAKFFYDATGSILFDQICELPEYYLPRVETAILRAHVGDFAHALGSHVAVVEPGSGASTKTLILLDALERPAAYIPVDISDSHLMAAAAGLRPRYPSMEVLPVCADFTRPFRLPLPRIHPARTLVFFPGSTIGNFQREEAIELLANMKDIAGSRGLLLVGADLRKDPRVLERAYNDSQGVTAAFNRNMLVHLNHRFGCDFDVGSFEHRASWNEAASRIEMHLESTRAQSVRIGGERFAIARGERIWTESCHKYDARGFAAMAAQAGLDVADVWVDEQELFSMQVLLPHRGFPRGQAH